MEISELTIKIVILLLPGLFGASLAEILCDKSKMNTRSFIVSVVLIGFLSYFLVFIILNFKEIIMYGIKNFKIQKLSFFDTLINSDIKIRWGEVLNASVISIFLGIIIAILFNKGLFYGFFRKLKITNNSGKGVWAELFDNDTKGIDSYVYVVDKQNDIRYKGWVSNYSNDARYPELVLRNVIVTRNSNVNDILRKLDKMYLEIDKKNMIIEIGEIINES